MKMVITLLRQLNEGRKRFLVEFIGKTFARSHNLKSKWKLNPSELFKAQSLTVRREIIGNRYLTKQLD